MNVNIRRVVEDVSNRTTQLDAIYEAITNSIQANATHITCRLFGEQTSFQTNDGDTWIPERVAMVEIEDDGDGFNEANCQSFQLYRTAHKEKMGCKGIGRFIFLKVFRQAVYTSHVLGERTRRELKFTVDFDDSSIVKQDCPCDEQKTVLRLQQVTERLFDEERKLDRRIELVVEQIRDKVLIHLIPTLFFRKRSGGAVQIVFVDAASGQKAIITESDIPDFKSVDFEIVGYLQKVPSPFTLYHAINQQSGTVHAFHCANGRAVCSFHEKDLKPAGFSGYLLLESPFFDPKVNNERNDFHSIYPVKTDFVSPISWEDINRKLKDEISKLVRTEIPQVEERNRDRLREIQEERPYLVSYIDAEDLDVAAFVDKKQIIDKAKRRFSEAKDNLLKSAGKEEYSDSDLQEAIQVAQDELVAYIQDRIFVVERLKAMLNRKEKSEELIHNLFMQRGTKAHPGDYLGLKQNNLWVLDDRFTSYSYAASEQRVQDILGQKGSDSDGDRPDIALFFSQDPSQKKGLKSVIIELKPFRNDGNFDRDKYKGILQLQDYIAAFQAKEEIEEIWAFLVTDVDENLAKVLTRNKFVRLFSTHVPIYHQYFDQLNSSIYVIGVESLILDAEARNKVFMEIVKKQSRLRGLFEKKPQDGRD